MIKRVMVLALLAGAFAVGGSASAHCDPASVGHRGGATVDAVEVEGERTVTVTLDARYIDLCDDGSVNFGEGVILGAPTTLTITGDASCTKDIGSDWDPFGFAVGVHEVDAEGNPLDTDCGIDITWSGFLSPYLPDAERSGASESGGQLVVSKITNHEDGRVWVDGVEYAAHGAGIGVMWTGVGANA